MSPHERRAAIGLREELDRFDRVGGLVRVGKQTSPRHEAAAISASNLR